VRFVGTFERVLSFEPDSGRDKLVAPGSIGLL
jgi:hypothetical protein